MGGPGVHRATLWAARWNLNPRWEYPGQQAGDFLIPGILPGHGEQGWITPPPAHTHTQIYTHTEAQVTDANLPPSLVLPVPPGGHDSPELTSPTFDKQGQGDV